ncbi:unnamed protein product, partial [Symbiodinium sp. KB8]
MTRWLPVSATKMEELVREDEEEDLQRALAASVSQIPPGEEASVAPTKSLDEASWPNYEEELEAQREQLAPGNFALKQMADAQIQEKREREKQLSESNEALQSRLEGLREALAQRGQDTQVEHEEAAVDEESVHRPEEEIFETRPAGDETKEEVLTSASAEKVERLEEDQKEKVENLEEEDPKAEAQETRQSPTPEDEAPVLPVEVVEGAAAADEKAK